MKPLRFGLLGTGFWARYQLHGWRELAGVNCVAVCDPVPGRAAQMAADFGIPFSTTNPVELLTTEPLDFVDIVSSPASHAELVRLAADHGVPAICQKPLCPTLAESEAVAAYASARGVPLFVHENFRWQTPLRRVQALLRTREIGRPWRARVSFNCSFPVFDNQPALRLAERFILADVGVHTLDVIRWLFGEPQEVHCQTARIRPDIQGEDAATVFLRMKNGMTVINELSFASRRTDERFPQTFLTIEGELGTIELGPDFRLSVTTATGTRTEDIPPPVYPWADPRYAVVHSSIPACHANIVAHLRGEGLAETIAADNLLTLRLVERCYESAERANQA